MPPHVLTVQSSPSSGPRRLSQWASENGITLDVVAAYEDSLPTSLDADGLIVLGGGYLPDEDDRAPWLPQTRALTAQALDRDVPYLGICLGGQLLAHVGGGRVAGKHGLPESGSTPLQLRPGASNDPLFTGLPAVLPGIEHHEDQIVELPPGADWLAQSQRCPYQAFRIGGHEAWGLQCHPEVAAPDLARWNPDGLREQGFDHADVLAQAQADEPTAEPIWREVFARFSAIVRERVAD